MVSTSFEAFTLDDLNDASKPWCYWKMAPTSDREMHRQYTNNSGSSEAEEFTQEELQEFAQAFKMFDKDGNGTMNIKELGVAMRTLGMNPTEEELQNMVNEYDVDGNGKIDFGEFCKMMKEMNKETDQELIRLAFKYVFFLAQVIKRRSLEDVFMAGI
ncbi:hypothetical protein Y032_0001g165 [Ancylostoma ceylanicum]|uniref:EF-hand domain-containing protein n=2 Tax=Ancylostoma ceylanicum TaxID=53326 RepID=A0A016W3P8_9BILA|nr:hypothetical protein Y032_0001g165 [Ancylostoma ceylanicum]